MFVNSGVNVMIEDSFFRGPYMVILLTVVIKSFRIEFSFPLYSWSENNPLS